MAPNAFRAWPHPTGLSHELVDLSVGSRHARRYRVLRGGPHTSAAVGLLVVAGTASTLVYLTDAFKCPLIRHLRRQALDSERLSAGLSLTSALCLSLALAIAAATLAPRLFYT